MTPHWGRSRPCPRRSSLHCGLRTRPRTSSTRPRRCELRCGGAVGALGVPRCSDCVVRHLNGHQSSRGVRGSPVAPLPCQRARHSKPRCHAHEPALQRCSHTRSALPLLAAGADRGKLTRLLLSGTFPGVIAGSVIRVELLAGQRAVDFIIAIVLVPLGVWLFLSRSGRTDVRRVPQLSAIAIVAIATVVGGVGGRYGIGGGSILAPVPIGSGRPASDVAPLRRRRLWSHPSLVS
jgi:hypothetical protein